MDLVKLVVCLDGAIQDVLLDMRVDSPTFKQHISIELSAELGNVLYIPHGIAHGFQVISNSALMLYKVSKVYSPTLDSGVLWSSAGIRWPISQSILSDRDKSFQKLDDYVSPFRMPVR
jgi:dTDP-4-dehydrorhamnose 3,5-epimerase